LTVLSIDIETYSDVNLSDCGMYKYVDSDEFQILLLAYAFDDEAVAIVDLAQGEKLPERVTPALLDKNVLKTAFNAQFERVCINKYFNIQTENWECTKVMAASLGIAGSLESVGTAINLESDQQKLWTGKRLIRIFSIPHKVKDENQLSLLGSRRRILPEERPEDWEMFKEYCKQDVEAERAIRNKLSRFYLNPPEEHQLYSLDQVINDRGVMIDLEMAQNAIAIDTEQTNKLTELFRETTGLENPNSLTDIKKFIREKTGRYIKSITKKNLYDLKKAFQHHPDIITALEIREKLSKTSIAKYQKMLDITCKDGRARGLLQFYGASTGRWAGRLIQVQNLPQNHIKDLDTAREIVKTGDLELLEMMYDNPSDILSQCIRPAIIPAPGHKFIVADFSAIEARVIAWFAGEQWRLDVFNSHGKIYEASASQMFGVPIEQITKGSDLRQKGKVAELALGYQGGPGALISMGALKNGLTEEELPELVKQWRKANPKIVRFWYDVENAAKKAIKERTTVRIGTKLKAIYQSGFLFLELPSSRRLAYAKPKVVEHDKFPGKEKIIFHEVNPTSHQWEVKDTYGGKLVENIVQATARDCLAHSLLKLDKAGYKIVMHVHDEVVIEAPKDCNDLDKICTIMGEPIPWAPGLPLRADGFECKYYQKD